MTIEWTPRLRPYDTDRKVKCASCEWEGDIDDTAPIEDFTRKIYAGDTVPVGECLRCGSLAHYKHRSEDHE